LLERCNRDRRETLARLKAPWPRWLDELTQQLEEAREHKRFNGNQLRAAHYTAWLQSIREWATSEQESLQLTDAAWKRLTPTGIADAWREGTPLDHPGLHELPLLREGSQPNFTRRSDVARNWDSTICCATWTRPCMATMAHVWRPSSGSNSRWH
jgi:exodeoxyribonuclease V beta subunit